MIQTELQNQKHLWATFLSQSLNYGNFLFSRWWSVKFSFSLISKLLRSNVRIGTSKKCMLNHRLIRRKKETKYDFFFFSLEPLFPFIIWILIRVSETVRVKWSEYLEYEEKFLNYVFFLLKTNIMSPNKSFLDS